MPNELPISTVKSPLLRSNPESSALDCSINGLGNWTIDMCHLKANQQWFCTSSAIEVGETSDYTGSDQEAIDRMISEGGHDIAV